jgi:hypothetical protein
MGIARDEINFARVKKVVTGDEKRMKGMRKG